MLLTKEKTNGECYVLYCFDYDRSGTKRLFDFLLSYFSEKLNISFQYMGFYDKYYADHYGKINGIANKIAYEKWDEVLNITLDISDVRVDKHKNKLSIDFGVTRPNETFIVVSNDIDFDFSDFVSLYYGLFKSMYGFSYDVDIMNWPTAYAIGDWEHAKKHVALKKVDRKDLERWRRDCGKIEKGLVRGIYQKNILSQLHMDKALKKETLYQWIEKEKMGSLFKVNERLFLWELTDEQLLVARKYVSEVGLIL